MKLLHGILMAFVMIAMICSCSDSDDDSNTPDPSTTHFTWDIDGTTYDCASTSTYDGVGLYISAQDRQDATITMEIRSRTDGVGIKLLDKNDGDPDDDQTLVLKINGNTYTTTALQFVQLEITSLNEQDKAMEGSFSGLVVNKDDNTDILTISNGSFSIRYF